MTLVMPLFPLPGNFPQFLRGRPDGDQTAAVNQAEAFQAALQTAGVHNTVKIYPGRGHSEILFTALPEKRPQIVPTSATSYYLWKGTGASVREVKSRLNPKYSAVAIV
jgi:acetyl esterase/lipase